ncbi:MAG: hypothetical protein J6K31_02240 [Parabacteroides sp.]|nr:hypothetical protein [Parabacteroides sp.]
MKRQNNFVAIRLLFGFLLLYGLVTVCYLPVFSNGFPRLGIVADRYLYLSLPGILLLVSYLVVGWIERKQGVYRKFLLFFSILLYSLYYYGVYVSFSRQWKDTDSVKHYLRSFYKGDAEEKDINGRENHD